MRMYRKSRCRLEKDVVSTVRCGKANDGALTVRGINYQVSRDYTSLASYRYSVGPVVLISWGPKLEWEADGVPLSRRVSAGVALALLRHPELVRSTGCMAAGAKLRVGHRCSAAGIGGALNLRQHQSLSATRC